MEEIQQLNMQKCISLGKDIELAQLSFIVTLTVCIHTWN